MPKYCDVCKQPYPDDSPACPHCAAASAGEHHDTEPEIDRPSRRPADGEDSGIILVGPETAPPGDFESGHGSSRDHDRPAAPPGEDSGVLLAATDAGGSSSEVLDLDSSALVGDQRPPAGAEDSEIVEAMLAMPPPAPRQPPNDQPPPAGASDSEIVEALLATPETGGKATQLAPPGQQPQPEPPAAEPPAVRAAKETQLAPHPGPESTPPGAEHPKIQTADDTEEDDPSAVDLLHQPPPEDFDIDLGHTPEPEECPRTPPPAEPEEEVVAAVEAPSEAEDPEDIFVAEESPDVLAGARPSGRGPSLSSLEIDEAAMEAAQPGPPSGNAPSSETLARSLLDDEDVTVPAADQGGSSLHVGGDSGIAAPRSGRGEEAAATPGSRPDIDLDVPEDDDTEAADVAARDSEEEAEAPAEPEEEARDEEEEVAKKPAKRRGRGSAWVGGGLVGLVLGSAACIGLWAFGIEPPQTLKMVKPKEAPKSPGATPGPSPGPAANKAPEPAADPIWALLGQHKKANDPAVQAEVKKLEGAKGADPLFNKGLIQETLGDVASARRTYEKGLADYKDAPNQRRFQAALDRLDTRSDAGGDQPPGDKPPAKPRRGRSTAAPPPHDRARFAAAVAGLFLPVLAPPPPPAPAAGAEADEAGFDFWKALKLANREHNYSAAIAALDKARAIHQQQRFSRRNKGQNPASDPTEEIFLRCADELRAYWALRSGLSDLTKLHDPAKALDKLVGDTKAAHVNLSAVAAELKNDPAVTAADPELQNLGGDVQLLLQAKKKAEDQVAAVTTALEKAKVLKAGGKDLAGTVRKLAEERKQAADALGAAHDLLEREKYIGARDTALAAAVGKLLADKKATDGRLRTTTAQLQAERETVHGVAERLAAAKLLPAGADRGQLLQGVDRLVREGTSPLVSALGGLVGGLGRLGGEAADRTAHVFDLTNRLAASRLQVVRSQFLLARTHTPEQMLDIWVSLLQGGRHDKLAEDAAADARRVLAAPGSDAQVGAEARCVQGLALRSQGKFVQARDTLDQALKGSGAAREGTWRAAGEAALKDLTDPKAYFLPKAEQLWASGQPEEALLTLTTGLEAFPDNTPERGRLLARRSLVQLHMARARFADRAETDADLPFAAATPRPLQAEAVAAATQDAQAAVAAGAVADGHYALGQIAQAVGQWARAAEHYRQALQAGRSPVREQNRYRLALAQVFIRMSDGKRPAAPQKRPAGDEPPAPRKRPAGDEPPAPQKRPAGDEPPAPQKRPAGDETKTGRAPSGGNGRGARQAADSPAAAAALVALLLAGADADRPPSRAQELQDARGLAVDAIREGDPEGHLVLAQVLAREDQWTVALMEYLEGMRRLSRPPEITQGLQNLVAQHPAFKIPDSLKPPQPLTAERHYAEGLRLYWDRRYPAAENEFREAVRYNGDDARYSYFLGLTCLQQGRGAEAREAFRKAGVLEKQGLPDTGTVNAALERVQGARRLLVDEYRR